MKLIVKSTLFALGLAAGAFAAVPETAAPAAPPAAPAPQGPGAPGDHPRPHLRKHDGPRGRGSHFRHQVARKLELTPEQMTQLKSVREKQAAELKALRADTTLAPEAKKAKVKALMQAAQAEREKVLTPEQLAKFRKMRAHVMREHNL